MYIQNSLGLFFSQWWIHTACNGLLRNSLLFMAVEGSHGNEGLLLGKPAEEPEQPITENSLLEILDGIVMMYNLSVHQQLGKVSRIHFRGVCSSVQFSQPGLELWITNTTASIGRGWGTRNWAAIPKHLLAVYLWAEIHMLKGDLFSARS